MKDKALKNITIAAALFFSLFFVAKFAGPEILKLYVEAGIGNCRKIPILCVAPTEEIYGETQRIDKEYLAGLTLYKFPDMQIYLPKSFQVFKEKIKKVYYKKVRRRQTGDVAYLLYEKPYFFINLFPQAGKLGIKNDYEFFSRIMYAQFNNIQNLGDVFFVIVKSIFIPDLGDSNSPKIVKFSHADFRGFIAYSLGGKGNYFNCDIFNTKGDFFKIYIKDKSNSLDLSKVLGIISTIKR